jgi:acyl-[acyl-carrier-protein] desaturase
MKLLEIRKEVMLTLEKSMDELLSKYLKSPDTNWQPSDFLPDAADPGFHEQVKEIQELSREMNYDLFVTLIGDTITEEALPTYESWLMSVTGIDNEGRNGWSQWIRSWTAEENRHGDLLNKQVKIHTEILFTLVFKRSLPIFRTEEWPVSASN